MPRMKKRCHGFTLIELIVVLAVIAILAMIAVPSIQDKLVRDQIVEAMKIADIAKPPKNRNNPEQCGIMILRKSA